MTPGALVPRPDFGSFHRFLVSLGVLLSLAALIIPWVILGESSALRVSLQEIEGLTPLARSVIRRKQELQSLLIQAWPYISLLLFIAGMSLTIFGLVRWRGRQRVADQVEDLSREKLEGEVRQLTPREISEKLDRESTEVGASRARPDRAEARTEFRAKLLEIEAQAAEKLAAAHAKTHTVRTNVAVQSKEARVEIDIVLQATPTPPNLGTSDIVVELKYLRRAFVPFAGEWMLRAARNAELYREATGRNAAAVLLFIVDETDDALDRQRRDLERQNHRYQQLFTSPVIVLLYSAEEFGELPPGDLRRDLWLRTDEEGTMRFGPPGTD